MIAFVDPLDETQKPKPKTPSALDGLLSNVLGLFDKPGSDPDLAQEKEKPRQKRKKKAQFKEDVIKKERQIYQRNRKRKEAVPKVEVQRVPKLQEINDAITVAA